MFRSFWSLPLFSAFGIRVRADLFLLLYAGVEIAGAFTQRPPVPGLAEAVALAMGILFASVLLHEYGHCLAARRAGGTAEEIVLWPLGGLSTVDAPSNPAAQFWTAFGGPAVNLLLAAVLGTWVHLHGGLDARALLGGWQPSWAANAFRINVALLAFNLLPAFPMDGGRMLRALCWGRMGYGPATLLAVRIGKVSAVLLGLAGVFFKSPLLVVMAFLNFLACEQERQLLASGAEPSLPPAEGFPAGFPEEPSAGGAGWFARRRRARREREALARQEREARLRSRVDAILEKISLQGMQGLTDEERATLKEASDLFRHSRR